MFGSKSVVGRLRGLVRGQHERTVLCLFQPYFVHLMVDPYEKRTILSITVSYSGTQDGHNIF